MNRRIQFAVIPVVLILVASLGRGTNQDVRRYFAYASAALGRPYTTFYIRSADAWREAFNTGTRENQKDFAIVTPGRRLTPYRDFAVEYPPGFFLATLPPALITRDERTYMALFEASMVALMVAALWLCVPIARRLGVSLNARFAVTAAIFVLALGKVPFERYDPLVAILFVIMCWATLERRPVVLGLAVTTGVVVKIVPLFAGVMCGIYLLRGQRRHELIVATIVAAAAAAIVFAGMAHIGLPYIVEMLRYHLDRPAEFESTAAAVLGLWTDIEPGSASINYAYGSTNVVGKYASLAVAATTIAAAAGLLFVCFQAWRALGHDRRPADRARTLLVATTTGLALIIALGKVASAQYLAWVFPLGLLVSYTDDDEPALWMLLCALLLNQFVYPLTMRDAMLLRPWAFGVILARNLVLLLWAAALFRPVISRDTRLSTLDPSSSPS